MFVTRLLKSRRHLSAAAIPYAPPVVAPASTAPTYRDAAPFVTRTQRSRRHQWAADLLQRPFPTTEAQAPWPSFEAVKTLHTSFKRTALRPPQHDEYPYVAPVSQAPVSALFKLRTLRRKPRQGLFLAPSDYIEADVVQPVQATVIHSTFERRPRRRRTHYERLIPPDIDFIEKVPPAGEEFEAAWRAPIAIRRLETGRNLLRLPIPVIAQEHSPGWTLATAIRRRETTRTLLLLPTLSFFKVPGYEAPAFTPWPTLHRRDISRRTALPLAPPHITVAAPPFIGPQGYPAFTPPAMHVRRGRGAQALSLPTLVPRAFEVPILGLQPPQYVVGRMSLTLAVRGRMTLAARGVDGRMTNTHAVDGSFDPSEGHEGSVL